MPKMLVPLAEGFEEIEAITIIDVCRRGGIDVTVAGVTGITIKGGQGIEVNADCLLDSLDIDNFDMITLPGGLAGTLVLSESENEANERTGEIHRCHLCSTSSTSHC